MRREPSGDAKAQNTVATLPDRGLKRSPELYLAAAADHGYAGTGHYAGFESEACYRHKTRPIHTAQ